MATRLKYDKAKKELTICGVGQEQEGRLREIVRRAVESLEDTVPAEVVLEQIRKRVPLAGTPAGALRAYRLREEFTQGELAAKAGISQGHISEMEKGRRSIGVRSAKKLAKALNCRWEQLLTE
jgi:DNA-binding XRE family transcriptional regulator